MKKIFILCLSLLFISCAKHNATESLINCSPVRFVHDQKYVLFNPNTEEVILYPRYTYIEPFSNGYGLGILGMECNVNEVYRFKRKNYWLCSSYGCNFCK